MPARRRLAAIAIGFVGLGLMALAAGQTPDAPPALPSDDVLAHAAATAELVDEPAVFSYFNRQIIVFRARVLGRPPRERAESAERTLGSLIADGVRGPVDRRVVGNGAIVTVGGRLVVGITPPDVDELSGERVEIVALRTQLRLQHVLEEVVEARTPSVMIRAGAVAFVGLAVGILILWGLWRARQRVTRKLVAVAEKTVAKTGIADVDALRASRLLEVERGLVTVGIAGVQLMVSAAVLAFVLRRFPYTRPWGESLVGFLLTTVESLGLGIVRAIPGLFTAVLIFLFARFLIRLVGLWFGSVQRGRVNVRWLHPETVEPTRRLATTLVWLFAVVMAYPYLPGSNTDAFKGVSVFLGLMVTFGSSGLINQIMSGFMVTYSRALRVGDFVRIGDIEGTVTHLGVLSTKVRTVWSEVVTVPNAVVASTTTTDYTRAAEETGVLTPTSVTIGYDAPWRQVHALLLAAAERTPGLRRVPKPLVLQTALQDFYVQYTLLVCLERQELRPFTLDVLHARIQDLFNEHGVQIMSPNYVLDPRAPKVVPKERWFAAPARPEPSRPED